MNDPIERLRGIAAAHVADTSPDVAPFARGASALRLRRGGMGSAAVASVVAAALAMNGGTTPHGLDVAVTTTPPATRPSTSVPSADATLAAVPDPWSRPATATRGDSPHEPPTIEPTDLPTELPTLFPTPSPTPSPTTAPDPTPQWLADVAVGPAPYYGETTAPGSGDHCAADKGDSVPSRTWMCQIVDLVLPASAGGDYVAKYALCAATPTELSFATEQEVEMVVNREVDGAVVPEAVYTWANHQTFAPTPHRETVASPPCLVYAWHLPLADDAGQPLVSGAEYWIEMRSVAPEAGVDRGLTPRIHFTAP
jgi:hypothetical protein